MLWHNYCWERQISISSRSSEQAIPLIFHCKTKNYYMLHKYAQYFVNASPFLL